MQAVGEYSLYTLGISKILWQPIKGNLTKVELGAEKRKPPLPQGLSVADRNRRGNRNQERIINYRPQEGKQFIASPTRNWLPLQQGQWETVITLNSCFFLMDLDRKRALPPSSLLPPLLDLAVVLLEPVRPKCNSLLFLNKPILLVKQLACLFS